MQGVFPTLAQIDGLGASPFTMLWFYGIALVPWFFLFFVVWTSLFLEMGLVVGRKCTSGTPKTGETIALGAILALLGLLLAFTYNVSLNRLDQNMAALTAEAEATGTLYARLELLDSEEARDIRELLHTYSRLRVLRMVTRRSDVQSWDQVVAYTNALDLLTDAMWPRILRAVKLEESPPIRMGVINAANGFYDSILTARVSITNRMQIANFAVLLVVVAASMFVIGQHGGSQGFLDRWRSWMLVLVLSVMLVAVVDLDRPFDGFVRVNDLGLRDLNQSLIDAFELERQ